MFLIRGNAGGYFSRLTLRRVMGVESGSERFRVPKTSFQENVVVNDAVPVSTKYKNKWAVSIFAEWQRLREVQVPLLDCGGLLRWLNTVLAVCEYMSFAKSWQEKGCSSQAETWQVKNILIKDFD